MTLLHTINCSLLAFGPLYILRRATNVKEPLNPVTVQTLLYYLGAQILKSLVMINFPVFAEGTTASLLVECLSHGLNLLDVFAFQQLLHGRATSQVESASRPWNVGLTWATADALASGLLPFFFSARSGEFSWRYLQHALYLNVNMIALCTAAHVAFYWVRQKHLPKGQRQSCYTIAALGRVAIPIGYTFAKSRVELSTQWFCLSVLLSGSLALAEATRRLVA